MPRPLRRCSTGPCGLGCDDSRGLPVGAARRQRWTGLRLIEDLPPHDSRSSCGQVRSTAVVSESLGPNNLTLIHCALTDIVLPHVIVYTAVFFVIRDNVHRSMYNVIMLLCLCPTSTLLPPLHIGGVQCGTSRARFEKPMGQL